MSLASTSSQTERHSQSQAKGEISGPAFIWHSSIAPREAPHVFTGGNFWACLKAMMDPSAEGRPLTEWELVGASYVFKTAVLELVCVGSQLLAAWAYPSLHWGPVEWWAVMAGSAYYTAKCLVAAYKDFPMQVHDCVLWVVFFFAGPCVWAASVMMSFVGRDDI